MTHANVMLWGRRIGAVRWMADRDTAVFEYEPAFVDSHIQVAPFEMPLRRGPFQFPALPKASFHGLPGLLANSLPDRFGTALINRWLADQGRSPDSFNPVERLCYTGTRGMGALEFEPATGQPDAASAPIDIAPLVDLVSRVLQNRENLSGHLIGPDDRPALRDILKVGTSAGGARAKAVLAWNPATGEFRSGQVAAGQGFDPWLIKFDGVQGNADHELADPMGFGRLEYACALMARDAGVDMMPCRLHTEGGRAHFMTRRFDRTPDGGKLHMQSFAALRHFDFNQPRAHSYEQVLETIRGLGLGPDAMAQQVRRAILNVVIRNQDDHVKNIAFLMEKSGQWRLAPAFDVTYAHNPAGAWTREHQMSIAGKTDGFTRLDMIALGRYGDLKPARTRAIIDEVLTTAANWDAYTAQAGVDAALATRARAGFRTGLA